MDGSSRTNAAPDQDAHRRCPAKRRVRLFGLPLRTRLSLAAQEEPGKAERNAARPRTLADSLLRSTRTNLLSLSPCPSEPCPATGALTRKPDAGNPPVRFGGRGDVLSVIPTPICRSSQGLTHDVCVSI